MHACVCVWLQGPKLPTKSEGKYPRPISCILVGLFVIYRPGRSCVFWLTEMSKKHWGGIRYGETPELLGIVENLRGRISFIFVDVHPGKLIWQKRSTSLKGKSFTNGGLSVARTYQRVSDRKCSWQACGTPAGTCRKWLFSRTHTVRVGRYRAQKGQFTSLKRDGHQEPTDIFGEMKSG